MREEQKVLSGIGIEEVRRSSITELEQSRKKGLRGYVKGVVTALL